MYMLQQQSQTALSTASNKVSDDDCTSESDDDDYSNDGDFLDEVNADGSLQVSSVDTLFADHDHDHQGGGGGRSSGALIRGKKSKPDRINLRSTSEQEADKRLDDEYGLSPAKLYEDFSGGFHLPIAKIKTMFDTSKSDVRYHHLNPPSLDRNISSSSQNMVDLELAPAQRRHAAEVSSVSWDLSKTAWSQHIQQSAFDASSRPANDWEAPSNEVTYEKSKVSMWWQSFKYSQSCWWFWQITIAVAGVVVLLLLISRSKQS